MQNYAMWMSMYVKLTEYKLKKDRYYSKHLNLLYCHHKFLYLNSNLNFKLFTKISGIAV